MEELLSVSGKVCIITGSASGLGKAYAEILLQNNARVCLSDVSQDHGKETLEEFSKKFGAKRVHFVSCDVTKKEEFISLFDEAEKYFNSQVELLVNNAGINPTKLGWRKCMDVNIYGVMIGTEIALDRMSKSPKKGTIVNCASLAGFVTGSSGLMEGSASYYASKHACVALSRDCASEFKNNGIMIKCLCPAYANTAIIKLDDPIKQEAFDKKINQIGVLEPREVAEGFYKLVTECKNGSVMAVIKDYPYFLIPDYGMVMVLGLGFISKIANKLSGGLDVVKPFHQLLCFLGFMILFEFVIGWIL